jgi:hypothetical protein
METLILSILTGHSFGRRTHLNKAAPAVAWICICSTLLMGCYTTMLIDTKGDEKGKFYSNRIEYVITKEGRKYVFETPPSIRNDTIVGEAKIDYGYYVTREVAISVSEVGYVSVAKYSTVLTVVGIVTLVGFGGIVVLGLTFGGYGGPLMR